MHRHPLIFAFGGGCVCVGTLIFFLRVQILLTSSIGGVGVYIKWNGPSHIYYFLSANTIILGGDGGTVACVFQSRLVDRF